MNNNQLIHTTMLKFQRSKSILINHKRTKKLIEHKRVKIKENLKLLLVEKNHYGLFELQKSHKTAIVIPFFTTATIVYPQIGDSSSKTSKNSLSHEELKFIKERNHVDALKNLVRNRSIGFIEKSPSSSTFQELNLLLILSLC